TPLDTLREGTVMARKRGKTSPVEGLMPAPAATDPEREVQPAFSFPKFFQMLGLVALIFGAEFLVARLPNRVELGPRRSELRFERVRLPAAALAPLELVGAWKMESPDRRFGGLSGLAIDRGRILAISDSGVLAWFPKPGTASPSVYMRELPTGPRGNWYRWNRDTEALTLDPGGRGWWVAYEHGNELWLYDPEFRHGLRRVELGYRRWPANLGIEGIVPSGRDLLLFLEEGRKIFRVHGARSTAMPVKGKEARFSEAVRLPGGRLLAIERRLSNTGFENRLVALKETSRGFQVLRGRALPVGRLDNVEGMTAERLPNGRTRLWLVTDDNFQRPLRTLLLAIDLPPGGEAI
ncbi:MAG: esterase-like activity of phytase family protein, partial [Sphingomicrobium sp.]